MIQPQEIRIANYIEYNGEIIKLDGSLLCCYIQNELEFPLNPIPLTEEILLKFGFKYREFLNDFFIKLDDHNILIAEKEVIWFAIYKCEENQRKYFLTKRYYAHQLQNLFFSLCGEELTFKN